jgi:drug/metabolite transporter (DMT)-like permease
MLKPSKELQAIFYVILSGVFYGSWGYLGIQILNADLSINSMLFWRFLIAALSIIPVCLITKQSLRPSLGPFLLEAGGGALLYGGGSVLYFMATDKIGTGLSMATFFSYPAMIMLFARLIDGKKLTSIAMGSLAMILVGVLFLKGNSELPFNYQGVLLALLSAFLYAIYVYLTKKQNNPSHPMASTLHVCIGSALLCYGLAQFEGGLQVPTTPLTWLHCVLIALICTSIPMILLLWGLETLDAGRVAILTVLEPVITVLLGASLLEETLDRYRICGIFMILTGAILIQLDQRTDSVQLPLAET